MKRAIVIYLFLFCLSTQAQDSIQQFNRVEVNSVRAIRQLPIMASQVQLSDPTASFAKLLQQQSGIYIRSQGNAVLNTPSYQGFGANQIPIFVEGMNVQSTMNSTFDLSLLSSFHFNRFQFVSTPNSAMGNPNIGPGLALNIGSKRGIEVVASASGIQTDGAGRGMLLCRKLVSV